MEVEKVGGAPGGSRYPVYFCVPPSSNLAHILFSHGPAGQWHPGGLTKQGASGEGDGCCPFPSMADLYPQNLASSMHQYSESQEN